MTTTLFPSPSAPVHTHCAAIQRIAALASDANSSPKDWVAVLGSLPDVSNRMLQIINASYSALPSRIASIHQAVVYLGFYTVKTLAMRLACQRWPGRTGSDPDHPAGTGDLRLHDAASGWL